MKIELALATFDAKSPRLNQSTPCTGEKITSDDIKAALGVAQRKAALGLSLLQAKYRKDGAEKEKAIKLLTKFAVDHACRSIGKVAGRNKQKAVELLVQLAVDEYCRTADTPGAKCRCGGRGTVYDLTATRQLGRPIEKTCVRCNGLGIRPLPAARVYRIVATLTTELSERTFHRSWKPFYNTLVNKCFIEESFMISEYNSKLK